MNRISKPIAKPFMQCLSSVFPSCFGRWTNISFVLMLTTFLMVGIPAGAKPITTVSSLSNMVAVADTSIVAYTEKKTRAKIPSAYKNKIDSVFKENLPVIELNGTNSWSFTTDFVIKEMESDWGISKDNQLMFIWDNICKQLTGRYACDNKDSNTLNDFRIAVKNVRSCGQRYKEGIMPFIEKQTAEYRRQIADAQKRIDEAQKRTADAQKRTADAQKRTADAQKRIDEAQKRIDEATRQSAENQRQSAEMTKEIIKGSNETLAVFKELYPFFKEHPGDERLQKFKSNAQELIRLWKKYGVDYKAVLSAEMLKFYGIEE